MQLEKEQCQQALDKFYGCVKLRSDLPEITGECYPLLIQLIEEHFKLVEKYEKLNNNFRELAAYADDQNYCLLQIKKILKSAPRF